MSHLISADVRIISRDIGNGTSPMRIIPVFFMRRYMRHPTMFFEKSFLIKFKEHFEPIQKSSKKENKSGICPIYIVHNQDSIKNHGQNEQCKKMPPNKLQRLLRISPSASQSIHIFSVLTTRSKISSFCCGNSLQRILVASTPYSKIGLIRLYFFIGQHSFALLRSGYEFLRGSNKKLRYLITEVALRGRKSGVSTIKIAFIFCLIY